MKMKKSLERKLLIIDEAWSLLSRTEESEYLLEIVKTSRKYNLGLLLITQDVADLLQSRASNAILQNSSYKLLMRQQPAVIELLTETFNLSDVEKEKLLTANVGEGLLLMENEHTEIRCLASKEEHKLITTNPDELLKFEDEKEEVKEEKEQKEVKIKVDESKGFFRKSEINDDELNFLLKNNYVISSHVPLDGGRREDYLLKPPKRESNVHFFLVKSIEEYLRNFTDKIKLFESVEPDIVFYAGKKKVAIEIESGNKINKDIKFMERKVSLLNKKFGKDWFFVVTDSTIAYRYEKLGPTYARTTVCRTIRNCFENSKK